MQDQTILAVDKNGKFSGEYVSKIKAHTGSGIHHLAMTVFIINSKDQILLQKRKHEIFDNIWDNTASTHQLHLKDHDETDEEATLRCLKNEWGIEDVKLKNWGGINYQAKYGKYCENEFCKVLIGLYDGKINLDPKVGYGYKWMDKKEFLKDIQKNPNKYTPWCQEAVKILNTLPSSSW